MCRTRSFYPFIVMYIWIILMRLMLRNLLTTVFAFAGIVFPAFIPNPKTSDKTTKQIYIFPFLVPFFWSDSFLTQHFRWCIGCFVGHGIRWIHNFTVLTQMLGETRKRGLELYIILHDRIIVLYYNCTRECSTTVTTAPMIRHIRISKITYKKAKMAMHGVMVVIISFHINVFQRLVTLHNTKVGKFICTKIMDFDLIFCVFPLGSVSDELMWFLVGCRHWHWIFFFSFATNWRESSLPHALHHSRNDMSLERKVLWWVFVHIFSFFYYAFCIRAFRKIQEWQE